MKANKQFSSEKRGSQSRAKSYGLSSSNTRSRKPGSSSGTRSNTTRGNSSYRKSENDFDGPKRSFRSSSPGTRFKKSDSDFSDKPRSSRTSSNSRFSKTDKNYSDKPRNTRNSSPGSRFKKSDNEFNDRPRSSRASSNSRFSKTEKSFSDKPRNSRNATSASRYKKSDGDFGDKPRSFKPRPVGSSYDRKSSSREDRFDSKPRERSERSFSSHSSDEKRSYRKKDDSFSSDRPKRAYTSRRSDDSGSEKSFTGRNSRFSKSPRTSRDSKSLRSSESKPKRSRKVVSENVEEANGSLRLNRYISNAGICSRREADKLISAGLVSVNGQVVTEMGMKVSLSDDVRYNGQRLQAEEKVYLIMNKPKDTITTTDDPEGRRTVMELLEPALQKIAYPVGRLDRNTTGVLLFTNDGELAQRMTHPKYSIQKIYKATLNKSYKKTDMFNLVNNGVELEDGPIQPDSVAMPDANDKAVVGIEIHSGRNRIIHRIFESQGYLVDKLDRVSFAGLSKSGLKKGQVRHLTDKEVKVLKRAVRLG